ncbi:MAG: hypothetical protein HY027_16505 [Deltaproteobacteria bacterium]|nr:hypothetical protein [Deltaproteobacteria bacterium]
MMRTPQLGFEQISLHFCQVPRAPQFGQYSVTSGSPTRSPTVPESIRFSITTSLRCGAYVHGGHDVKDSRTTFRYRSHDNQMLA